MTNDSPDKQTIITTIKSNMALLISLYGNEETRFTINPGETLNVRAVIWVNLELGTAYEALTFDYEINGEPHISHQLSVRTLLPDGQQTHYVHSFGSEDDPFTFTTNLIQTTREHQADLEARVKRSEEDPSIPFEVPEITSDAELRVEMLNDEIVAEMERRFNAQD